MPHPVMIGKRTRMSFSKIKEIADLPNLIEIQVDSYKWFLEEGLKEVFNDISPIEDYTGNLICPFLSGVQFLFYRLLYFHHIFPKALIY